jgi:hypothetical protein
MRKVGNLSLSLGRRAHVLEANVVKTRVAQLFDVVKGIVNGAVGVREHEDEIDHG